MLKTIFLVLTLGFSASVFSRTYSMRKAPKILGQEIQKEVVQMKKAFAQMDVSEMQALQGRESSAQAWVLSRIRFMVQPLVKFKYLVFELKVAPMLEFRWQRKPPRGWKMYHPHQ